MEKAHVQATALPKAPHVESGGQSAEMMECPTHPTEDAAVPRSMASGAHIGGPQSTGRNLKASGGLGQRKKGEQKRPTAGGGKCKLSVHYEEGEQPMAELLRLAGGQGMDVIVEALAPGSKAEKAGVKPGFALASMNGRNEFMQLPGWQVRLLLEAPITLGFDPEPVPPQSTKCTEIRLTRGEDTLGIPSRVAVCGPKETGVLAEEVIFNQSSAPLWLSAWSEESFGATPDIAARSPAPRLYELRRPEAHAIVGHAIRGARDTIEQSSLPFEAEWFKSAASGGPRRSSASARSLSPSALCSMDCVAECLEHELVFGPDQPPEQAGQKASSKRQAGGTDKADPWSAKGAKGSGHQLSRSSSGAAKAPPGDARPADAKAWVAGLGSSIRDDRSPLRWLAPVLERVLGESPSPRGGAGAPGPSNPRKGGAAHSPRPAMNRGSSPKPLGASGDDASPADPDLSATMDSSTGAAGAAVPTGASRPQRNLNAERPDFRSSARSDTI